MTKKLILYLCLHLAAISAIAQSYPTNYFSHPLHLPVSIAGDFAEIRPNHFHSGLDLRTDGKEGEPVYAPADGYVSRINISAWGGGKVLYITHPNGYRTVYMHLSAFCGETAKFVRNYQYTNHLYAFDIELPKDSIKVRKGEVVALTGNSGGSTGPHLHYEIRYAENDQPINPFYFGIQYSDPIAPTIKAIKIYPADQGTLINGKHAELRVAGEQVVRVAGRFYVGIYTYDQMEPESKNKNGVEKIELYVDDCLFFRYHVPTFLFEDTRVVNALIDYPQFQLNREYFIITRHLRGVHANFSTALRNNGYLWFRDGKQHTLEYRVSDYKGNTSRSKVIVRSDTVTAALPQSSILAAGEPIAYFKKFTLQRPGFKAELKANTVYDNDQVLYAVDSTSGSLAPIHRISLRRNPLPPHQSFTVTLPVPSTIPEKLRQKLTVVCINGKTTAACSTVQKGSELEATTRSFGGFSIQLDTVPPTVKPLNFKSGTYLSHSKLNVKIADNLTGVVSYGCYINGEWQLAEHDGKTSSLTVDASHLRKGTNKVVFILSDAVGNRTEEEFKLLKK